MLEPSKACVCPKRIQLDTLFFIQDGMGLAMHTRTHSVHTLSNVIIETLDSMSNVWRFSVTCGSIVIHILDDMRDNLLIYHSVDCGMVCAIYF